MKIGFISSPVYLERIRKLVENEFDHIEVTYLTYQYYSESAHVVDERQQEFDALLFSGSLAYYYCRKHCRQEIPWLCIKRYSTMLANAIREARSRGYNVSVVSAEGDTRTSFESAYREVGIDPASATVYTLGPAPADYAAGNYPQAALDFHLRCIQEHGVTCCFTSTLWTYNQLIALGIPVVFLEVTFDTFRNAFYQLYLQFMDRPNELARIAAFLVELDLPGEHAVIAKNEFQYMQSKLRMSGKVYAFADRLQAVVNEAAFNQYLIICTYADFERETHAFKQFELFESVNSDVLANFYFGVGLGRTAVAAKQHAYLAIERAKCLGRNTACLVAANGEVISAVYYIKPDEDRQRGVPPEDKLNLLAKRSGLSAQRLAQLYEAIEADKTTQFTSAQLAQRLGVSKRSMDRMILRLENAGLLRVVGQRIAGSMGRPSRVVQLLLGQ